MAEAPICIVDVGARGGFQSHWDGIRELCTFVGFEPDPVEAKRLSTNAQSNERYLAHALSSQEGTAILHHCAVPSRSSLYEPNLEVLGELYGTTTSLFSSERTESIPVTALDSLLARGDLPAPNFLKLDTQGSELDILKGALDVLDGPLCAIETEVEFVPLYRGQPLFSDIDPFLRAAGYALVGFTSQFTKYDVRFGDRPNRTNETLFQFAKAWASKLAPPNGKLNSFSQLIYGDALYVRSPREYLRVVKQQDAQTAAALVTKAAIVTAQLRCYEYALQLAATAETQSLITGQLRHELECYARAHSRSLAPVAHEIRDWSSRLLRRLQRSNT